MFQLPNVEFEQTAFCIMKTFQGVLKKEEFGIYLLTYLHPRDTPAPPLIHTLAAPARSITK